MDDQRISKETRDVVFTQSNGSEFEGVVFLELQGAHHLGSQTVGDLLNEAALFIPTRTAQGVFLANISQLMMAKVSSNKEADETMKLGEKYAVRFQLFNDKVIEGEIYVRLPEGFQRVNDYLNESVRFLPVFLPEHVVYINQQYICFAQELS